MQAVQDLSQRIGALDAKSQGFARSLCDQFNRRGTLSPKQLFWVDKLLEQTASPKPAAEAHAIGSVKGIVDLLERAAAHLKYPAIIVRAEGVDVRLNIAGPRARKPGSINVCSAERDDTEGRRTWYGRITRDGAFEPSLGVDAGILGAIRRALAAMASNPAKAAADYGRLTGHCCFCRLPLTDERSTSVGYGSVCADHYGLPWGKRDC